MVTRFAGKRFVILIPSCIVDNCQIIAEDLRQKVMALKPENLAVTVSIGITSSEGIAKPVLEVLIAEADSAIHLAQQQGYNCTCLFQRHS